jgi:hypothetical protein
MPLNVGGKYPDDINIFSTQVERAYPALSLQTMSADDFYRFAHQIVTAPRAKIDIVMVRNVFELGKAMRLSDEQRVIMATACLKAPHQSYSAIRDAVRSLGQIRTASSYALLVDLLETQPELIAPIAESFEAGAIFCEPERRELLRPYAETALNYLTERRECSLYAKALERAVADLSASYEDA